jgi:hypothetical protein
MILKLMYKIITKGEGRNFECALQFAIINENALYGASFVGFPSAAWAVDAALCSQNHINIETNEKSYVLWSGALRHFERKVGRFNHILVLPKFNENDPSRVIVIDWEGNIKQAVGRYMAKKFHLPAEWVPDYYDVFRKESLTVIFDPELGGPIPTGAVRLFGGHAGNLMQEDVDEIISKALRNGKLKIPPSDIRGSYESGVSLQEYLKLNAHVFATQVAAVKPLHDPADKELLNPAIVMDRIPYPSQAHTIAGCAKLLKKQKTAILCGDMGTGKSIIALGVVNVLHSLRKDKGMSVVLTSPGMVVPKWFEHEIKTTLPDAGLIKISSLSEAEKHFRKTNGDIPVMTAAQYLTKVRAGYKPEGLEFVVLSIDRAKLGPSCWYFSGLWKRIAGSKDEKAWHCPDCGKVLMTTIDKAVIPYRWQDFVESPELPEGIFTAPGTLRKGEKIKWKQKPPIRKCPHCGTVLMRPALKSRGETNQAPRWYAALILKKLRKHFDLYIADEVHQTKAENSGRGFAFAELVKASKKVLCLTGTLVNGMSTSIKEILWRTNSRALLDEGFDHKTGVVTWASRYGVLEKVIKVQNGDDGINTRRRRYQERQPREKPGISPELAANHLLHHTVFLELPDIGLPLVKLKEIPVIVNLDDGHYDQYKIFHERLREACIKAYNAGNKGAFARFIPATINAVDRADAGIVVGMKSGVYEFPAQGKDYYNAKERKLVEIVRENLQENRGCFVYCNYTDRYDVHRRVQEVLKAHGIDSAVLESNVSQEERVGWLAEQAHKGTKVIVCNMCLVETGLDLLYWPTLIFYQLNYNINTVRQASRRAWRIGQTKECRVYYMVADGTQQLSQFEVCLEKRANALMTEGRLDKSELSRYISKKRSMLATDLAQCIADEEIGIKWADLAAKDIEDVEMVEEARFHEVLRVANDRLANETLRLCGLAEEEIETADIKDAEKPAYADLLVFVPIRTRKKKQEEPKYEQLTMLLAV